MRAFASVSEAHALIWALVLLPTQASDEVVADASAFLDSFVVTSGPGKLDVSKNR
jgi:hypothetical protein